MRSRNITIVSLLLLGCTLAAQNVWISAARSMIPLELDAQVITQEVRREKHPGKDDVHIVRLDSRRLMQIDGTVYSQVATGDQLRKERWSRQLLVNGSPVSLAWSPDARGMIVAMPLMTVVLLATAAWASVVIRNRITEVVPSDRSNS